MSEEFKEHQKKFNNMFDEAKGIIKDALGPSFRRVNFDDPLIGNGTQNPFQGTLNVDHFIKKIDPNTVEIHVSLFRFEKDKTEIRKSGDQLLITLDGGVSAKPAKLNINVGHYLKGAVIHPPSAKYKDGKIVITCIGQKPSGEKIEID